MPSCATTCSRLGRELRWHPPHMRARYDTWIEGLNSDWLVSRQRYFGVPFPVWYRVGADGEPDLRRPDRCPTRHDLPGRPVVRRARRVHAPTSAGKPGGFVEDPDVMDTWATSSLTPQIVTGWVDDPDLFGRTFPMDLRPQGPEIIRTWLFDTVVRARFEHGVLPWSDTTINGWVLDPDRKKMSKSKGNVVTPMPLVEEYGPDALRYWACNGRPAVDTAVDYGIMKIGRKLAIKILERVEVHAQHRRRELAADQLAADDDLGAIDERARPVDARGARRSRRRRDHRVRRVRLRRGARAHRAVLLVVLRRLRRAREGPRLRRCRRVGGGVGGGHAAHRALDAAPDRSRRSCRS